MSEENSILWTKIRKNNLGSVLELKDKSLAKDIKLLISHKGTIIQSQTNEAEFMIPNGAGNDESLHSKSLYLSVVDIEGGGPQPRTNYAG